MSLERLEYFRQPKERAIGKVRKAKYCDNAESLVDLVERLEPNEVAVLTERIVPVEYYSSQNFLKRGDAVRIEYPRSAEEVRDGVVKGRIHGPTRTRNEAFKRLRHGFHAGYEWFTPDFKERRRVMLDTCVNGFILYALSFFSESPADKIKVKRYHSKSESPIFGYSYQVEAPSCSRDDSYAFRIRHFPSVEFNPERVLTVRRLKVEGHDAGKKTSGEPVGCQFQHYMELTFKRPEVTVFCNHAVAAYLEISRLTKKETRRLPLQPFAIPNVRVIETNETLRTQVLRAKINNEGKIKCRLLNHAEREIFWWHYAKKNAKEQPFYAREGLQKYKKALNL